MQFLWGGRRRSALRLLEDFCAEMTVFEDELLQALALLNLQVDSFPLNCLLMNLIRCFLLVFLFFLLPLASLDILRYHPHYLVVLFFIIINLPIQFFM